MEQKAFPNLNIIETLVQAGLKADDIKEIARAIEQWKGAPPKTLPGFNFVYCIPEDNGEKKLLALPFQDDVLKDFFIGIEIANSVYLHTYFVADSNNIKQVTANLKSRIKKNFPWIGLKNFPVTLPTVQDLFILNSKIGGSGNFSSIFLCNGRRGWVRGGNPGIQAAGVYDEGTLDTSTYGLVYVSLVCRPQEGSMILLQLNDCGAFCDEDWKTYQDWKKRALIKRAQRNLEKMQIQNK